MDALDDTTGMEIKKEISSDDATGSSTSIYIYY